MKSKGSSRLDGCQHVDRVSFEIKFGSRGRTNVDRISPYRCESQHDLRTFSWWMKSRSNAGGAVEVAFDHDNSDVIMET